MTATHDRPLTHHTGWGYFPIAFIARLPFAMMVVGVLTLVASATGSVALAGLTSAAVGIGVVTAGPVIGDLVDRHGQRPVLIPLGLVNGALLVRLPPRRPDRDAGAAHPRDRRVHRALGAAGRGALAHTAGRDHARPHPARSASARTLSRVMSYESAVDETAFVIGPVLVGILAAFIAPWAPIAIAAVLSFAFVTAFALHPTATAVAPGSARDRAPLRAVLSRPVLVLVAATFGVGLFFGATLTSLTAFAKESGNGEISGTSLRPHGNRLGRARPDRHAPADALRPPVAVGRVRRHPRGRGVGRYARARRTW